jgi:hypothetical protein
MVLFVDRRLLASVEKLPYLVMNIPICGWSTEPTKSLTSYDLENGGSMLSKTSANCRVLQHERW